MIDFKDWEKIDLKVGIIKEVKDHPDADKLYILKVNTGEERTLVAGIKEYYKKEELKGKKVIVFTNLKPVKIRGIESQGMLLATDRKEVVLLTTDKDVEEGVRIR